MANSVFISLPGGGGISPVNPSLFPNGLVTAPSISFINDPQSGRYLIGTDNIGEAINGSLVFDWNATRILSTIPIYFPDGTAAVPSIAFASDIDTGFYWLASGQIGLTFNNSNRIRFSGSGVAFGAAAAIAWTASNEPGISGGDLALFRDAANVLALRNGTNAQRFNIGQGNTALAAGRLAMGRDAAAAFAPGAGYGMLRWEAGTNAGTLKLVAYSGTSTTGVDVVDNVGGGN